MASPAAGWGGSRGKGLEWGVGKGSKRSSTELRASQAPLLSAPYFYPESAFPSPELHPGTLPTSTFAAILAGC